MNIFVFWSLLGILVFTQLAFAGIHVWAYTVMNVGIFFLTALVVSAQVILLFRSPDRFTFRGFVHANPAVPWLLLFVLIGCVQVLPLPAPVVKLISPQGFALKDLAGCITGIEDQTPRWMQLSMIPSKTKIITTRFLAYACLFLLMIRLTRSRERIVAVVFVLVGMGLFQVLYGMAQTFSPVHKIWWYPVQKSGQGFILGTYINANHLAVFLEMVIPLCFGLVFAYWPWNATRQIKTQRMAANAHPVEPSDSSRRAEDRIRVRKVQAKRKSATRPQIDSTASSSAGSVQRFRTWLSTGSYREQRIIFSFMGMVLGLGLFLTGSRGGVICFFVGTLAMTFLFLSRQRFRGFGTRLLILIWATVLYSLYVGIDSMVDIFAQQGLNSRRLDYTLSALPMLMDYPLFGSGMGTFKDAYLQYAPPFRSGKVILFYLHNDWLQVGVESGFVGLATAGLGYLWYLTRSIRAWLARRNHFSIGVGGGAIAALLAVGIHSLAEFGLRMPANALTVLVIAAIGWNALRVGRSESRGKHSYSITSAS